MHSIGTLCESNRNRFLYIYNTPVTEALGIKISEKQKYRRTKTQTGKEKIELVKKKCKRSKVKKTVKFLHFDCSLNSLISFK